MTEKFEITGMTCSHCVSRVKKALENVENVHSAEVRLESPQAIILSDKNVSLEELQTAVQAAGVYEIRKI